MVLYSIVKRDKPRLLVVDDSMEQQDMLTEMLIDRYDIVSAFNGAEALKQARKIPGPDLILMDVIIPAPDGCEVCSLLKSDHNTKDIPVILTSGLGGDKLKCKSGPAGASAYIGKPFTMKHLRTTLERFA